MWVPEEFTTAVPPEQGLPVFRNIVVRNLTAKNCEAAGRIAGLPETPLKNLRLENVTIEARKDFVIENTLGLQFENVKLNGKLLKASSFQTASKAAAH
jgi:hypothetical protein